MPGPAQSAPSSADATGRPHELRRPWGPTAPGRGRCLASRCRSAEPLVVDAVHTRLRRWRPRRSGRSGCRELTLRTNELQAELARRVALVCPRLLGLPGCGVLTAAKIVAEVAGWSGSALRRPWPCMLAWRRWRARPGLASATGCRGWANRQLNAALHRIAVTQLRIHAPAQA